MTPVVISTYDDLIEVLRARADEIGATRLQLDAVSLTDLDLPADRRDPFRGHLLSGVQAGFEEFLEGEVFTLTELGAGGELSVDRCLGLDEGFHRAVGGVWGPGPGQPCVAG